MTKKAWQDHWRAAGAHDTTSCAECAKRRATKRANRGARERAEVNRTLGLRRTKWGWE